MYMLKNNNTITVFEHQFLKVDSGDVRLTQNQLKLLQNFHGEGIPYFTLIHNGVKFNEYVGVIQLGNLIIEILPKADKYSSDENSWRNLLIGMLRSVYGFDLKVTGNANLKIKKNHILNLYFDLFIKEVEFLLHCGLIKKYNKKENNINVLKGTLLFNKQIQLNISNQEKFFTRHTIYDLTHPLNQIIYKTLLTIKRINTDKNIDIRIRSLIIDFPEMPNISISENIFNKLLFNRKTICYKKAIEISKMILLHFHPDISKGSNDVLAIMFDMNKLWEQFVYNSLKKINSNDFTIDRHLIKNFWKTDNRKPNSIIPDIVIKNKKNEFFVIDTKWKSLEGKNPSPSDLRQLYVYHQFYNANKVALVYPGNFENINGYYFEPDNTRSNKVCSIISFEENTNIKNWQLTISNTLLDWAN